MSQRKSKNSKISAVATVGAKNASTVTGLRNPVAANPLLGKSQAHGKTRKADRRASKVSLRKMPLERIACPAITADQAIGSSSIFSVYIATSAAAAIAA